MFNIKMEIGTATYGEYTESEMETVVVSLEESFRRIRGGKANTGVLEGIHVDYYGKSMSISQIATLSVLEGRSVLIQPWDVKSLSLIQKAIFASNLSLNPSNDGKVLRIVFPPLTEEGRKNIVKQVKMDAEKFRVTVRGIRRNVLEEIKKTEGDEDRQKVLSNEVQKITDLYIGKIDTLLAAKEQEIVTI